jgi:hypothetical protein
MAGTSKSTHTADLGCDTRRWTAADALRSDMGALLAHAVVFGAV